MVASFSLGCAASVAVIRPQRPPLGDARSDEEFLLVCQPKVVEDDEDMWLACQPTRIQVEVCESELEEGCKIRMGIHDLLSELDAYDDYIVKLRGEEVIE